MPPGHVLTGRSVLCLVQGYVPHECTSMQSYKCMCPLSIEISHHERPRRQSKTPGSQKKSCFSACQKQNRCSGEVVARAAATDIATHSRPRTTETTSRCCTTSAAIANRITQRLNGPRKLLRKNGFVCRWTLSNGKPEHTSPPPTDTRPRSRSRTRGRTRV